MHSSTGCPSARSSTPSRARLPPRSSPQTRRMRTSTATSPDSSARMAAPSPTGSSTRRGIPRDSRVGSNPCRRDRAACDAAGSPQRMPRRTSFGLSESVERSPRHPRPVSMGCGCSDDPLLHVRVPSSTGRLRSPDASNVPLDRDRHRVCVHYRSRPGDHRSAGPAAARPRGDAHVRRAARLRSWRWTRPSRLGLLSVADLATVRALALPSRRHLVDRVDPGSASGIETVVRLFLRTHGIRHRIQVRISGVGRVDLLIGDRLILEIDGEAVPHWPRVRGDRRRDLELVMRGYLVIRLSYRMVMSEWDARQQRHPGARSARRTPLGMPRVGASCRDRCRSRRLDQLAFA